MYMYRYTVVSCVYIYIYTCIDVYHISYFGPMIVNFLYIFAGGDLASVIRETLDSNQTLGLRRSGFWGTGWG